MLHLNSSVKFIFQKNLILFSLSFNFFIQSAHSQSWHLLPESPEAILRNDDIYFVNADTGWVVNVDGYIYQTTDGGNSFHVQLYQAATSFRCIGFANENKGWAGNLGPGSWNPTTDTIPLYETNDGGITWLPVTNIIGIKPKGICGINVVNEMVAYAVGRVGGPCYIMKTIDGGDSWTSVNFNPPAYYLIDCKFFSPDTGIVAGCTGTEFTDEKIAIWRTTDGGENWELTYHDSSSYLGHCWKLDFPSRLIGYASIESSCICDTTPVLKTIDGGITWFKQIWDTEFEVAYPYEQGIGFISETTGWCGGFGIPAKETTDGGETWNQIPFVTDFNRFRKINDSVAYACGERIWKYSSEEVGIDPIQFKNEIQIENIPNPFSDKTTIHYSLPRSGLVTIRIYDAAGRPVKMLVNEFQSPGEHGVELSLPYYYDTFFIYTLNFENNFVTRKAFMIY